MGVMKGWGVWRNGVVNSILGIFREGGESISPGIFVIGVVTGVLMGIGDHGVGVR